MNCQRTVFETAAGAVMNHFAGKDNSASSDDFSRILNDANKSKTEKGKLKAENHDAKNTEMKNNEMKWKNKKTDGKALSIEKSDDDCDRDVEEETPDINENPLSVSIRETLDNAKKEVAGELNTGQKLQGIIDIHVERNKMIDTSTEDILALKMKFSENTDGSKVEKAARPALEPTVAGTVTNEGTMNLEGFEKPTRLEVFESETGTGEVVDSMVEAVNSGNIKSDRRGSIIRKQEATESHTKAQGIQSDESAIKNVEIESANGKNGFKMETRNISTEESGVNQKEPEQSDLESPGDRISESEKTFDLSSRVLNSMGTAVETNGTTGEKQDLSKTSLVNQMSKSIETGIEGDKSFMKINLKPHLFGEMSIAIVKSPEGITARISAEKDVVSHLLIDSSREIAALFEEKNIKVVNIVIEARESSEQQGYFSGSGREGSSEGFNQRRGGYGNMEPAGMDIRETEEASQVAASDAAERRINGEGINIIV